MKKLFCKLNEWTDRKPIRSLILLALLNAIGIWASFHFAKYLWPGTSLLLTGFLMGTFLLSVIAVFERHNREN